MSIPTIGMPWFAPASYQKLLQLAEDPHELPVSYINGLRRPIKQPESLSLSGDNVVLVSIDVNEFVGWCTGKKCRPSAATKRLDADQLFEASGEIRIGPHWEDVRQQGVARI